MLQFVTNINSPVAVSDQILRFIDGGGRWVEIDMPGTPDEDVKAVVEKVMPRCLETECFLLLVGRPELAKEINVGGVRLRKGDMLPSQARMLLGAGAVIGVDASSIEDVRSARSLDVDYFALGPLSELGLEKVEEISDWMQAEELLAPRVAIGGVTPDDVEPLMKAGLNGVSVSDAIALADDIGKATAELLAKLPRE